MSKAIPNVYLVKELENDKVVGVSDNADISKTSAYVLFFNSYLQTFSSFELARDSQYNQVYTSPIESEEDIPTDVVFILLIPFLYSIMDIQDIADVVCESAAERFVDFEGFVIQLIKYN